MTFDYVFRWRDMGNGMIRLVPLQCEVCGRFIPAADLDSGAAHHIMLTPSSHVSNEEWETTCRDHTFKPQHGAIPDE